MAMSVPRGDQEGTIQDPGAGKGCLYGGICCVLRPSKLPLSSCSLRKCEDCAAGLLLSSVNSHKLPVTCCTASYRFPVCLHDFSPADLDPSPGGLMPSGLTLINIWIALTATGYQKVAEGTVPKVGEGNFLLL